MKTNNISYFTDANTCQRYKSFLPDFLKNCQKSNLFRNAPALFRKDLFGKITTFCDKNSLFYHRIMQPGYAENLCGIYIPETRSIIFCLPLFEDISDGYYITDVCKNISSNDSEKTNLYKAEALSLKDKMYSHLAVAKSIHDDWEEIYISNMDFKKADEAANLLISEIFKNCTSKESAVNVDRFFGSMLTSGSVNYIDDITGSLEKRIFIKGRPGTGKSTVLKKIRAAALSHGFDTETYYCSFDPSSLDMVAIRDLSLCIFDSTSPHEMFPSSNKDSIFDIYDIAVASGTDEKFSQKLESIKIRYDIEMAKAKEYLADVLNIEKNVDLIYEKHCADINNAVFYDVEKFIL